MRDHFFHPNTQRVHVQTKLKRTITPIQPQRALLTLAGAVRKHDANGGENLQVGEDGLGLGVEHLCVVVR